MYMYICTGTCKCLNTHAHIHVHRCFHLFRIMARTMYLSLVIFPFSHFLLPLLLLVTVHPTPQFCIEQSSIYSCHITDICSQVQWNVAIFVWLETQIFSQLTYQGLDINKKFSGNVIPTSNFEENVFLLCFHCVQHIWICV